MFGYLVADLNSIDEDEKKRYQALYCGLCHELRERFGQLPRMALTYDLVFMAMLYGSLYEPAETEETQHCPAHPKSMRSVSRNPYHAYAADLTVALAYHKCLDDWKDERKASAKMAARALEKHYGKARESIPRQCEAVERELAAISEIEEEALREAAPEGAARSGAGPDEAAGAFGRLMGEIFVLKDDVWADTLYALGDRLGRFVYLMDAACDMESDARKGSYNPFLASDVHASDALMAMTGYIGQAAEAFERLPLERDLHLMRSIVYSGVWCRYNTIGEKRRKKAGKGPDEDAWTASIAQGCPEDAHEAHEAHDAGGAHEARARVVLPQASGLSARERRTAGVGLVPTRPARGECIAPANESPTEGEQA